MSGAERTWTEAPNVKRSWSEQEIRAVVRSLAGPAHDPRTDPRPEARSIFNPAFVDVPEGVRQAAVQSRIPAPVSEVVKAWKAGEWGEMPYMALTGSPVQVVGKREFLDALPHLGTARIAYHAAENFVCREYGFLGAAVVAAELECVSGIVCDSTGHHLYCQTPVWDEPARIEVLVWEPQADEVVWHTDPAHHYTGERGFAILI